MLSIALAPLGIVVVLLAQFLDGSPLGEGYGLPTAAAMEAAAMLARTEGILVDPVYTAKALAGLFDRVRAGAFDGQRVIFWHGGGLPAIFEDLTGGD